MVLLFIYNKTMGYKLVKLNTARNSLRYVIKAFDIKEIYVPYYICPAIRNAVKKENCKIVFYHIDTKFKPTTTFPRDAYILYPNYFGVCSKNVEELASMYPNLIVDNAHSFFAEPQGIASFNSLRKFFPTLRNGSFLYTKKIIDEKFEVDTYSYENKLLSREELVKNENMLDKEEIKYISEITFNYFSDIDLLSEKQLRKDKFNQFNEKYKVLNNLKIALNENDFPFSYPYLTCNQKDADAFVNSLNQETYRYWTNLPDSYEEKIFYTNLVSISF